MNPTIISLVIFLSFSIWNDIFVKSEKLSTTKSIDHRFCGKTLIFVMHTICRGLYNKPSTSSSLIDTNLNATSNWMEFYGKQRTCWIFVETLTSCPCWRVQSTPMQWLNSQEHLVAKLDWLLAMMINRIIFPLDNFNFTLPLRGTNSSETKILPEQDKLDNSNSRTARGIVDECCKKPCSMSQLRQYCLLTTWTT